jgi:glycerophosphoryl diester phosphodiesterase
MMSRAPLHPAFLTVPLAHRGYHDAALHRPENSLSAFGAAIAAGYGIELDVQLTADGQAMVFHDNTLDRMTTSTGAILVRTATELGKIKLRGSDDLIPTLPQVLALVAGKVPVLIEIKDQLDTMQDTSGRLEAAVARALSIYHGPVAVMSFNPNCMAHMARLAPTVARGMTTEDYDPKDCAPIPPDVCDALRMIPDYDRTECSFISHKASDLARPRVAELKSQGAAILCWTIRSPEVEAKARQIADNITFEGYPAAVGA